MSKLQEFIKETRTRNPFYSGTFRGNHYFSIDSVSRLERAKEFTAEQCRAALALDGLQKTVRTFLERRLRTLEKA